MSPLTPSIWLAEAQSSQRDMLESLQGLKQQHPNNNLIVLASHRSRRLEIFEFADQYFLEPHEKDSDVAPLPRWQFVLEQAKQHHVKVLLTGRNGIDYEAEREQFDKAGIRLLTGATSAAMLNNIDDKFQFIQRCHAHNIPVAEGWRFDNLDELTQLLEEHSDKRLCVKPVSGIFAQGFWRLDSGKAADGSDRHYDSFEHLYFTDNRKINIEQYISAYSQSAMVQKRPIPMLLMPYLPGQEYSIDVVCERGEVLAAVTRHKVGKIQHIGYDTSVMDVVTPLIKAFDCDGIVSVQTKQDKDGVHRVLEINSRPSGGIGYTKHSGVDLTQVGFAYWLGWSDKPKLEDIAKQITPCQVRPITTSVKINDDVVD